MTTEINSALGVTRSYHENGNLAYIARWVKYDPDTMEQWPDSPVLGNSETGLIIRVGTHGRYASDGSVEWEFQYSELGKLVWFTHRVKAIETETRLARGLREMPDKCSQPSLFLQEESA